MYDRYTITLNKDELALTLGVEIPSTYSPHYNAAPTKRLPVITSNNNQQLSQFQWGLMANWSNNKTMSHKLYNLPIESIRTRTTYKRKLKTHRCVIPMDGFYVWKQVAKKQMVPHYFHYSDRRLFTVAGLWEEVDDLENSTECFIMITKPAENGLNAFQDDMPAILDPAYMKKWLEGEGPEDIEELLQTGHENDFVSHTVSPRIRDIDKNDVSLIQSTPASDQHGNYTLFT